MDGINCAQNWFRGATGLDGLPLGNPAAPANRMHFTANAPPVFGFEDDVDEYCFGGTPDPIKNGLRTYVTPQERTLRCVQANANILNLHEYAAAENPLLTALGQPTSQTPFSTCRNFERQVCAARGMLPGQQTNRIRFATAPKHVMTYGIGTCPPHNYAPRKCGFRRGGAYTAGFASNDLFYLEVCVFNKICKNAWQLWKVEKGQDFMCDVGDPGRFAELKDILMRTNPI